MQLEEDISTRKMSTKFYLKSSKIRLKFDEIRRKFKIPKNSSRKPLRPKRRESKQGWRQICSVTWFFAAQGLTKESPKSVKCLYLSLIWTRNCLHLRKFVASFVDSFLCCKNQINSFLKNKLPILCRLKSSLKGKICTIWSHWKQETSLPGLTLGLFWNSWPENKLCWICPSNVEEIINRFEEVRTKFLEMT